MGRTCKILFFIRRNTSSFCGSPVVKNLASHNMSPYAPAVLVTFLPEPIMSKDLSIKIVRLERGVMDMSLWTLKEEEAMMVDQLFTPRKAVEDNDIFPIWSLS
jgi:hypothetical protein